MTTPHAHGAELLACPWCANQATYRPERDTVGCGDLDCPGFIVFATPEEWNRRAPPPSAADGGETKETEAEISEIIPSRDPNYDGPTLWVPAHVSRRLERERNHRIEQVKANWNGMIAERRRAEAAESLAASLQAELGRASTRDGALEEAAKVCEKPKPECCGRYEADETTFGGLICCGRYGPGDFMDGTECASAIRALRHSPPSEKD